MESFLCCPLEEKLIDRDCKIPVLVFAVYHIYHGGTATSTQTNDLKYVNYVKDNFMQKGKRTIMYYLSISITYVFTSCVYLWTNDHLP